MQMRDLGLMGEAAFSLWCNSVGLIANGSEIDKTGWDFFVEFPVGKNSGLPADMLPAPIECKVQVKATDKRKHRIQISISNLNRLVKAQMPAFICVIQFDGKTEAQEAYLVHVGKNIIERTLKRMRALEVDGYGDKFHKHELTITYGDKERLTHASGESLKERIESYIDSGMGKYMSAKNEFIKTIGFNTGSGRFTFSVASRDPIKDVVDWTLGLRHELNIDNFAARRSRFGIVSQQPFVEGDKGVLSICQLKPFTQAIITFKQTDLSPGISFPVDLYSTTMNKVVPNKYIKFKAKNKFFELVFEPYNNKANYKVNLESKTDSNLKELRDILKLLIFFKTAPSKLLLEIKSEGRPPLRAQICGDEKIDDWSNLYIVAEMAVSICHKLHIAEENIAVTIDDLIKRSSSIDELYKALHAMPNGVNVEFTAESGNFYIGKKTACLFFLQTEIGDHIVGCYIGILGHLNLLEGDQYGLNSEEFIYGSQVVTKKTMGLGQEIINAGFNDFEATLQNRDLFIIRMMS